MSRYRIHVVSILIVLILVELILSVLILEELFWIIGEPCKPRMCPTISNNQLLQPFLNVNLEAVPDKELNLDCRYTYQPSTNIEQTIFKFWIARRRKIYSV